MQIVVKCQEEFDVVKASRGRSGHVYYACTNVRL